MGSLESWHFATAGTIFFHLWIGFHFRLKLLKQFTLDRTRKLCVAWGINLAPWLTIVLGILCFVALLVTLDLYTSTGFAGLNHQT